MRLMFVYWRPENAGSARTIHSYTEAARKLGHKVVLYAPRDENSQFECSLDTKAADAVIFVLEWNLYLHPGMRTGLMGIGHLNVVKLISQVPKKKCLIIDNDGMYNDKIQVGGDYNHLDADASRRRIELCDSLATRIYQPTLHPLMPNVRSFLFHGYDSGWEVPLDFHAKEYGMVYVGNSWFRWRALHRVLQATEPIRERVGRIGLVGHNWSAIPAMPYRVPCDLRERAYYTDPEYLMRLNVEIMPPVPVDQVIPMMSKGIFNPVLVRPLFNHLSLVNPRLFETPAANTIPLFLLDKEYVQEIYGERATELVLGDNASEQIEDVLRRPEHYAPIVQDIRRHLAANHSYAVRLKELISMLES